MRQEPSASARPRDVIRKDLFRGLTTGLTAGLAAGLGVGLLFWYSFGPVYGLMVGLRVGLEAFLVVGLTFGLAVGIGFGAPSARRYLIFVLCSRGRLPWRLGAFLDWACVAGLLRLAGAAYQFRHRELQQWMTCHPGPPPV